MSSASSSDSSIDPLRGAENYAVWKVRMNHILTDLGYDIYVADNATLPPDTEIACPAAWNRADRKALSTIVLRVADNVLVYVSSAETAKEA
ncbi:hypothetical protein B0H14DRAFT_2404806 [Mycena olivaceomarginata]|nr:hypothetical protein B0H14DRAFT_2404806 [Mycena olivaceomarginata]